MKKTASFFILAAVVAVLSLAPARSFAQPGAAKAMAVAPFEGTVTWSIAVPQLGDDKLTMTTYMKGHKTATTIDMGAMGSQHMYMDRDTRTMAILMGGAKTGMLMDMPNDSASAKSEISDLVPTGKTETIDGYKAQEFTSKTSSGSMDIWATADLPEGVRTGMIESMKNSPQSGGSKAFSALISKGLAPVRITIVTGSQTAATVDLVKFDAHSLTDAEVNPPADVKLTHKTAEELSKMGHGQN
jgi:hypothetical protein